MTRTWTYGTRMIRGKKRRVKWRKHMGKTQLRLVGVRNLTDKEARREGKGKGRVKGWVNNPDGRNNAINHRRRKRRTSLFGL